MQHDRCPTSPYRSLINPGGSRYERSGGRSKAARRRRYRAYRGGAITQEMPPRRRNPWGAWGLAGADLHSLRSLRLWPNTASLVVDDTAVSPSFSFLVFDSQNPCARPTRVFQRPATATTAPASPGRATPIHTVVDKHFLGTRSESAPANGFSTFFSTPFPQGHTQFFEKPASTGPSPRSMPHGSRMTRVGARRSGMHHRTGDQRRIRETLSRRDTVLNGRQRLPDVLSPRPLRRAFGG